MWVFIKSRYWAGIPLAQQRMLLNFLASHICLQVLVMANFGNWIWVWLCFLTARCATRFVSACVCVCVSAQVCVGALCCALSFQVPFEVQRWGMSSCAVLCCVAYPANYCKELKRWQVPIENETLKLSILPKESSQRWNYLNFRVGILWTYKATYAAQTRASFIGWAWSLHKEAKALVPPENY